MFTCMLIPGNRGAECRFHHWLSAAEEREESLKNLSEALVKHVDNILLNSVKRGFSGITNKEFDFSQIMQGQKPGDYVYWLITFDPRFKNKSRELENAIKNGIHFRWVRPQFYDSLKKQMDIMPIF